MTELTSFEIVEKLSNGLVNVDRDHVKKLVDLHGIYGAARILGYDISHYDNHLIAGRLAIEELRSKCPSTLLVYAEMMKKRLSESVYNFIVNNHEVLQEAMNRNADFDYEHDWFSANTMLTVYSAEQTYGNGGIEMPQYTWMRIAVQFYHKSQNPVEDVIKAYEEMAIGYYTPASPTIFNAGMKKSQMASCFVEGTMVTTSRGVIPIESVQIGDKVVTHTQRTRRVEQVHKNRLGNRKIHELSIYGSPAIKVTEDHRFWACTDFSQPKWIAVKNLTREHFVAVAKRQDKLQDVTIQSNGVIRSAIDAILADNPNEIDDILTWDHASIYKLFGTLLDSTRISKIGPNCANKVFYACRQAGCVSIMYDGTFGNLGDLVLVREETSFIKVAANVETNETPEYVYTLGVEKDHSYSVEGFVAENCFIMTIQDDLKSILKTGVYKAGSISAKAGGLGIDISKVRHSEIGESGWSDGIIPMAMLYNFLIRYVNQEAKRKGAGVLTLRPHHIDIEEFLELALKIGDRYMRAHDIKIALWTSWIFWERIREDGQWTLFCPAKVPQLNDLYGVEFTKAYIAAENDVTLKPPYKKVIMARDLYRKIRTVQMDAGIPSLMDGDGCNLKSNHRHMGYISGPNLCVSGDTPILTSEGYFPIESLQNKEVKVWNGTEWSKVTIRQTSQESSLITVKLNNGRSLTCTPDHKFLVGTSESVKDCNRVPARKLSVGCMLYDPTFPVVGGHEELGNPGKVPVNASVKDKIGWLEGFFAGRYGACDDGAIINLRNRQDFASDIQLMLTTLGVSSILNVNEQTLFIDMVNLSDLQCSGLHLPGLCLPRQSTVQHPKHSEKLRVSEIIDDGIKGPTYCFTEEKNHAGVFNGILTGQCMEIVEYTDENTIASCILHSISLRMFGKGPIDHNEPNIENALCNVVDFSKLAYITRQVNKNLNKLIDSNWYPLDKTVNGVVVPGMINNSNKRDRPTAIGASGFAELLHIIDLPFEDPIVILLNKMLTACIYWNALAQSVQLAIIDGFYETFPGSPTSEGKLQFDLWKEEFDILGPNAIRTKEDDDPVDPLSWKQSAFTLHDNNNVPIDVINPTWDDLKRCIVKYGLRNSLHTGYMPTASTSQIRRNCETMEAHQNNMYSRKVLKNSYPVLNRFLVTDLGNVGAWNESTVSYLRIRSGSIQELGMHIAKHPELYPNFTGDYNRISHIEKKYKTMWEISQKTFLKLAADRGRYTDQSASTNIYIKDCGEDQLSACLMYGQMLGLKTIIYYLRQTGGGTAKFTANPNDIKEFTQSTNKVICTDDVCISCT